MTKFDFKMQLEVGQNGENLLMEVYPHKLTVHEGRDGDFIDSKGRKIELKTDTYDMNKTPNFFIERFSDYHRKTPGSVWQAYEHGCDIFIYMFVRNSTYFKCSDLEGLLGKLNKYYEDNPSLIFVKNRGWVTAGMKVPRELVAEYFETYVWGDE